MSTVHIVKKFISLIQAYCTHCEKSISLIQAYCTHCDFFLTDTRVLYTLLKKYLPDTQEYCTHCDFFQTKLSVHIVKNLYLSATRVSYTLSGFLYPKYKSTVLTVKNISPWYKSTVHMVNCFISLIQEYCTHYFFHNVYSTHQNIHKFVKPFRPNGISHPNRLDESISNSRLLCSNLQIHLIFKSTFCKQTVQNLFRRCVLKLLILFCTFLLMAQKIDSRPICVKHSLFVISRFYFKALNENCKAQRHICFLRHFLQQAVENMWNRMVQCFNDINTIFVMHCNHPWRSTLLRYSVTVPGRVGAPWCHMLSCLLNA